MLATRRARGQTDHMVANGRPEITNTGARLRANGNGPGYAPPGQGLEPRFGRYQTSEIEDPFERQANATDDCHMDQDGDWD